MKFKERKHFCDVTVACVAAGPCVEAAASYPEDAARSLMKVAMLNDSFNADETTPLH